MFPAGLRLALVMTLSAAGRSAAEPVPRVAPTRPGSSITNPGTAAVGKPALLPATRLYGLEFFSVRDVGALLGMKASWTETTRRLTLTDSANRLELVAGSREVALNG